jgi:hypothetical protein
MSDKGLITRIYRKLKNVSCHKINDPMNIWAKELKKSKWIKDT